MAKTFILSFHPHNILADKCELGLDDFIENDNWKVYAAILSVYLAPHNSFAIFTPTSAKDIPMGKYDLIIKELEAVVSF